MESETDMPSNIEIVDLMGRLPHTPPDRATAPLYERHMSPDLRVVEPRSLPYGGVFQGADELAELESIFHRTWARHRHRVRRYADSGDYVVAYLDLQLTARTTGDTVQTHLIQWWRFVAGKVVEIENFYEDTATVLAAITT
jgi:ketosteroid isomerase-like protein